MKHIQPPELPHNLKIRLMAAGGESPAKMEAALAADPTLKSDLDQFFALHQFDPHTFAQQKALEQFAATQNPDEIMELVQLFPYLLSDEFTLLVEQEIEQAIKANQVNIAEEIRHRLTDLQVIREFRDSVGSNPVLHALFTFLYAESDESARAIYQERHAQLKPYEAEHLLDQILQGISPELQKRFHTRQVLLKELRRVEQPQSPLARTTANTRIESVSTSGNQYAYIGHQVQVAGNAYFDSIHVETGGMAIIDQTPPERLWVRPCAPTTTLSLVRRSKEVQDAGQKLRKQSGSTGGVKVLAIIGMPGVGKTIFAQMLAQRLDKKYPGGVLFQTIGQLISSPSQVNPILNEWASYGFGQQQQKQQFTPHQVRAILGGHGPILIILDDVWHLESVQPLIQALPPTAHLIITTRSQRVADNLRGAKFHLDVLSKHDANELIKKRLQGRQVTDADKYWIEILIESVGRHTLALDVAVSSLYQRGSDEWAETAQRIATDIRLGVGFGELPLDEIDRRREVENCIKLTYDALPPQIQKRFHLLGTFTPDTLLTSIDVAALWQCPEEEARSHLNLLTNVALIIRVEMPDQSTKWQQHTLLRAYALALLHRDGEYESGAARHAEVIDRAVEHAKDQQRIHEMLSAMPSLHHAFEWAVRNDIHRALSLITKSMQIQLLFGMVREALEGGKQIMEAVQQRGTPEDIGHALMLLGNVTQEIAFLGSENQIERLEEALSYYDKACQYLTIETAPFDYGTLQNNRSKVMFTISELDKNQAKQCLILAMKACNEALEYRHTSALDYSQTLTNLAILFRKISTLPETELHAVVNGAKFLNNIAPHLQALEQIQDEPHRALMYAALSVYDKASTYISRDISPQDYSTLHHNRAVILLFLAHVRNEDKCDRLKQALQVNNEVLHDRTPNIDPAGYARTLYLRATILSILADELDEARHEYLQEALNSAWTALVLFEELNLAFYVQKMQQCLQIIRTVSDTDFEELWHAADAGTCPPWLDNNAEGVKRAKFMRCYQHYHQLLHKARINSESIDMWQAAVDAGTGLITPPMSETKNVNFETLLTEVGFAYEGLAKAYASSGDSTTSSLIISYWLQLQGGPSTYHRNQVLWLLEQGRLDEAERALSVIHVLEPESAFLEELEAQLKQAREQE